MNFELRSNNIRINEWTNKRRNKIYSRKQNSMQVELWCISCCTDRPSTNWFKSQVFLKKMQRQSSRGVASFARSGGGAKLKSGGAKLFYSSWIGLRRSFSEIRCRNPKAFSGRNHKFERFFRPKTGDLQKEKGLRRNLKAFSGRNHQFKSFFPAKTSNFFLPKNIVGGQEINRGGAFFPCLPLATRLQSSRNEIPVKNNQKV